VIGPSEFYVQQWIHTDESSEEQTIQGRNAADEVSAPKFLFGPCTRFPFPFTARNNITEHNTIILLMQTHSTYIQGGPLKSKALLSYH